MWNKRVKSPRIASRQSRNREAELGGSAGEGASKVVSVEMVATPAVLQGKNSDSQ